MSNPAAITRPSIARRIAPRPGFPTGILPSLNAKSWKASIVLAVPVGRIRAAASPRRSGCCGRHPRSRPGRSRRQARCRLPLEVAVERQAPGDRMHHRLRRRRIGSSTISTSRAVLFGHPRPEKRGEMPSPSAGEAIGQPCAVREGRAGEMDHASPASSGRRSPACRLRHERGSAPCRGPMGRCSKHGYPGGGPIGMIGSPAESTWGAGSFIRPRRSRHSCQIDVQPCVPRARRGYPLPAASPHSTFSQEEVPRRSCRRTVRKGHAGHRNRES